MSIFNRRNAALGWLTWRVGKRMAERKARSVVGAVDDGPSKKKLFVGALAAVGAVLFFWRRRDDEQPPDAS